MTDPKKTKKADRVRADWQSAHGIVMLLSFASLALVPREMRVWPVTLLLPLAIYECVALTVRPLRQTIDYLYPGRLDRRLIASTLALSLVSSGVLVLWQALASPTLDHLDAYLPLDLLGSAILTATVFSLLNAVLEEIIFRGVFYQAIEACRPWPAAVLGTAFIFGMGHVGGYPPGIAGAILAGIYGVGLGLIRHHSAGLLLPVLAHITADATIMAIRIHAADGLPS